MNIDAIASELLRALDERSIIEPFTRRDPGFDQTLAYEITAEILRRRRVRGERPIGRKIGFTNRLIWEEYGVSSPLWGFVYDSTVSFLDRSAGRLRISQLAQPRIEPEIILHFRDAPGDASTDQELLSTIDWIAHGFEIVQTHFLDWKFGLADTVADFGLHGALVVGPPHPIGHFDDVVERLRTFTITLSRAGLLRARGAGENVLGSPLRAARHLLSVLKDQSQFDPVGAGEIVTTGTLTPALPIQPGDRWSTQLSGIDLPGVTLDFD